jgi:type IV fimbrial biogenesis protein FimT
MRCLKGKSKNKGFTLLELIVVIGLAVIIMGIGVPSFHAQIDQNQRKSATVDFILGMAYARAESVRRGKDVYLRSLSGTRSWTGGWCVTTESDCRGEVIRQFNVPIKIIINSSSPAAESFKFNAQGFLASSSESLSFCGEQSSKKIVVTPVGQPLMKDCTCNQDAQCI